jgi:hypothetical protein
MMNLLILNGIRSSHTQEKLQAHQGGLSTSPGYIAAFARRHGVPSFTVIVTIILPAFYRDVNLDEDKLEK